MSAYYDLYETPSPDGKEDKKSLHARICPKRTYTQKEFVEHIATFQHLPKNVIGAALDACIDELCDLLANGNIVELGELGFFSTSLKCLRETDDEKKKIRSESVQFQNVHLRISSTFRNNIKKKMTLERVHSTTKKSKKVVETTEETRKTELELFLKQNVCINKNEYIQLSGLTRHAAIDFLANAGYDPEFGARPVKRAIQHYLLNDLSKKLLAQEVDRSKPITVDANTTDDGLVFRN